MYRVKIRGGGGQKSMKGKKAHVDTNFILHVSKIPGVLILAPFINKVNY